MFQKIKDTIFSISATGFMILVFAVTIAYATFIENSHGAEAARAVVYNARWFEILLLLLSLNLAANIIRFRLYRKGKITIGIFHLSFIIIVLGAAITRYFGTEGTMHIREGESSSVMLSADKWFRLEVNHNGKEIVKEEKVLFSDFSKRSFSEKISVNGAEYSIRSVDFISNAKETIVPEKGGIPLIKIVYAGASGMQSVVLKSGEGVDLGGVTIGFNNSADLRMDSKGEDLFIVSKLPVRSMGMGQSDAKEFESGESINVSSRNIYMVSGIRLVISEYIKEGKLMASPETEVQTGKNAVLVSVSDGHMKKTVPVWIQPWSNGNETVTDIGGIKFTMSVGAKAIRMPFSLKLNDFILERYPGSNSPSSYESRVTLIDKEKSIKKDYRIYMNHILNYQGYRFFQSSYDNDEKGTVLSVNNDFLGTLVTYLGYFMMFIGILVSIFNPESRFYRLMRKASGSVVLLFILLSFTNKSSAAVTAKNEIINKESVKKLSGLWVQGNDGRVKPFTTMAYEVVHKVSRKERINGRIPEEVVLGMVSNPEKWQYIPMIAIPESGISDILGIEGKTASYNDFFGSDGNYKILKQIQVAYSKNPAQRSKTENNLIKVDERLNVCLLVYRGDMFKMFPISEDGGRNWYSPASEFPENADRDEVMFTREQFGNLVAALRGKNVQLQKSVIEKISDFQRRNGADIMPSRLKGKIEILYNRANIFKRLFGWYLIWGGLLLILVFYIIFSGKKVKPYMKNLIKGSLWAGFLFHTSGVVARGYISGHMPWSNGYESMIYIAWIGMIAGLIFARRNIMVLSAASILSGLTLFVAHMSWMNPEITNLVPVLKSYWLTFHVAIITASYGFIGVCALIGLFNLFLISFITNSNRERIRKNVTQLTTISEAAMILGLYFLVIGTFLGGIWANESWGRYWGWDPKETWSLVTILVYTFITHMRLIPGFKGLFAYNVGSVFGLLSVLMTYFGVNYYLTGLHSYGGGDSLPVPYIIIIVFSLFGLLVWMASGKDSLIENNS